MRAKKKGMNVSEQWLNLKNGRRERQRMCKTGITFSSKGMRNEVKSTKSWGFIPQSTRVFYTLVSAIESMLFGLKLSQIAV
jgi:hypothetical protein